MKMIYLALTVVTLLLSCKSEKDKTIPYVNNTSNDLAYTFLTYYPTKYNKSTGENFPLMVFLHGAGERGDNVEMLKTHGPPKLIAEGKDFPCIIIAPLCPSDVWWDINRLNHTLDQAISQNRVDQSRIYLTGLSMGGYGTFAWAIDSPNRFAALAPICGGGHPDKASAIKDLPIWVFHGAKDDVVLISESQDMVDTLAELDAKVRFTVYPEARHDSWTETYNNPELYEWMFAQKKSSLILNK